jgi:hypothetical protein
MCCQTLLFNCPNAVVILPYAVVILPHEHSLDSMMTISVGSISSPESTNIQRQFQPNVPLKKHPKKSDVRSKVTPKDKSNESRNGQNSANSTIFELVN